MTTSLRMIFAGLAVVAASCGFKPQKILATYETLEVAEVRRSQHCQTSDEKTRVQLFMSAADVTYWAQARGLDWQSPAALSAGPYAVVEMGQRRTGGYGVAVSRSAVLRGGLIILTATFVAPVEGRMVTQAFTSPCVLVRLPEGRYSSVEVQDQSGSVRASGGVFEPGASPTPAGDPEAGV
jgi:hypothetical protein